ncbi:MAG: hypothetical protein L6R36_005785 [Xanthoria steineri]|nr:MAG: hypothetical protein L6R36_005785 [Xanthoria steineri]
MGNLEAASEWQGKAMEVAAACAGTDYDTYSESEATMGKIQQEIQLIGMMKFARSGRVSPSMAATQLSIASPFDIPVQERSVMHLKFH